jgi:hypothetical protein
VQGIEARFPEVPFRGAFIDDQLSPSARSALAKFLRVTEHQIKALELRQQFPILPMEWILRSIDWELVSPHRFVQGRAMYGFCPICIQAGQPDERAVFGEELAGQGGIGGVQQQGQSIYLGKGVRTKIRQCSKETDSIEAAPSSVL